MIDEILDKMSNYYFISLIAVHVIYIVVFFGIVNIDTKYMNYLNISIQIFICTYLIIKYRPFRKHIMRENDYSIIFGSAMFLLTNLGALQLIEQYLPKSLSKSINNIFPEPTK